MKKQESKSKIEIRSKKLLIKCNAETKENEKKKAKTMMKVKSRASDKMQWRNKIELR